jgi:hypothetical protein
MSDDQFDDHFDEFLREAAQDYRRPPDTPRAAMWARIEAARREQPAPRAVARVRRLPRPIVWGIGMAAALVIGVAIGQYTTERRSSGHTPAANQPAAVATGPDGVQPAGASSAPAGARTGQTVPNVAYRVATIEHLAHTEALLTTFRADARSGRRDPTVDGWARDLLGTTRMLLDSPAAQDPQLGKLLGDLELVLAQIAALPSTHDRTDVELIDDAVRQHAVLTRLRMAVPAGPIRAGT